LIADSDVKLSLVYKPYIFISCQCDVSTNQCSCHILCQPMIAQLIYKYQMACFHQSVLMTHITAANHLSAYILSIKLSIKHGAVKN